jgi:hypothetical protein
MEQSSSNPKQEETIIQRFAREKVEWREIIEGMSDKMKVIDDLIMLEVEVFSQRQRCIEYMHKLIAVSGKVNREYKELLRDRIIFYSESYNIRLDKHQKIHFAEVDLADKVAQKELVYSHLDYMKATLDTIDKIIYGIKWRIQVEEFKKIRT